VGGTATLISEKGIRTVPISQKFFTSYRQTLVESNEVLLSITIPTPNKDEYVWSSKQSRRKEDDISIVTTSIRIKIDTSNCIVTDASMVFGGMSAKTVLAVEASSYLKGRLVKNCHVHTSIMIIFFHLENGTKA
jgi:xanthine dehydrogenase/oxidase